MKADTVIEAIVRVRVTPEEMRPYPTIASLPLEVRAVQLIENAVQGELRWMTGVDEVVSVQTQIVERDTDVQLEPEMPSHIEGGKTTPACSSIAPNATGNGE